MLLVEGSTSTLFADSRYTLQAGQEVRGVRVHIAGKGLLSEVGAYLRGRRGRRSVGYARGNVTVAQKGTLEVAAGARVRWIADENAIEKLRAVKDPNEVAEIRAAAHLISDVFRDVLKMVRPGVTELDLAAEI